MRRRGGRARRGTDFLVAALFIFAVAGIAALLQTWNSRDLAGDAQIVDGDTLIVAGERVRLRGIDAPEHDQPCTDGEGTAHPCGRLAARHLAMLIDGGAVGCAGHDTDRYGRFLGVCRTGNEGSSLNAAMVGDGWAVAYGDHDGLERAARAERRGMWAWEFDRPADWRRQRAALEGEALPRAGLDAALRRIRAFVGWGGHHE
ncbi:MAG: thermonuclease family protein [Phyllobacteriaceae bacterium]|jgi:endonuclease YncB( thermonuclease family)|nr:thermonuclease family protein [Phyllobacteriaceae bacterium]